MKLKKLLATLLVMMLILGTLSVVVFANDEFDATKAKAWDAASLKAACEYVSAFNEGPGGKNDDQKVSLTADIYLYRDLEIVIDGNIEFESTGYKLYCNGYTLHYLKGTNYDTYTDVTVSTPGGAYNNMYYCQYGMECPNYTELHILCADGEKVKEETVNVAKIGSTEYASLAEAIAAVPIDKTETTITLIADSVIEGNAGVTVADTQNVVLDLAGHQLSNKVNEDTHSQVIKNNGTLTIKDSVGTGKIFNACDKGTNVGEWWSEPQYNYATNVITNFGNLTVEGGTIEQNAAGSICYAIDNNSNVGDAVLTILGGLITKNAGTTIRMFCQPDHENKFVMPEESTGVVDGVYSAIWVQLPNKAFQPQITLDIAGGTLNTLDQGGYVFYDYSYGDTFENANYNISGGQFNGWIWSYGANMNISGGTFACGIEMEQNAPSNVEISGGDFYEFVLSGTNQSSKFMTGGIYDNPPEGAYIADGYVANPYGDGRWIVEKAAGLVTDAKVVVKEPDFKKAEITGIPEEEQTEVKEAIQEIVTENKAVKDFADTGLKEEVETESDEIVQLLKDDAKEKGVDDTKITTDSKIDSSIVIAFTKAEVKKVSDATLFNKISYEVTPIVKTTVTEGDKTTEVEAVLHNPKQPLKFRLGVPFEKDKVVEVLHEGKHHAFATVQGDGTANYVDVVGTEFSEYSCLGEGNITWDYNTDSGRYTNAAQEQKGVVRFLYNTGLKDDEVLESKVFFFNFEPFKDGGKIEESAIVHSAEGNNTWQVAPGDGFGAFHADLFDLEPVSATYYSIGFVCVKTAENDTDGTWKASAVREYAAPFSKDLGNAYSPIAPIQPSNAE